MSSRQINLYAPPFMSSLIWPDKAQWTLNSTPMFKPPGANVVEYVARIPSIRIYYVGLELTYVAIDKEDMADISRTQREILEEKNGICLLKLGTGYPKIGEKVHSAFRYMFACALVNSKLDYNLPIYKTREECEELARRWLPYETKWVDINRVTSTLTVGHFPINLSPSTVGRLLPVMDWGKQGQFS